jgi:hypothetical protein
MSNQLERVKKIMGNIPIDLVKSVPGCNRAIFIVAQELLGKTFEGIPAIHMDDPRFLDSIEEANAKVKGTGAMLIPDFEDGVVYVTSAHTLVGPQARFHKGLMGKMPFMKELFGDLPANVVWEHNQKLKPVEGWAMSIKDVARFHAFMGPFIRKLDEVNFKDLAVSMKFDASDRLAQVIKDTTFKFDQGATTWFMGKVRDMKDMADLLDGFNPAANPVCQVRVSTFIGKSVGWVSKDPILTGWAPVNDQLFAHLDVESAIALFDQLGWKNRVMDWKHAVMHAKRGEFSCLHSLMGLHADSTGFEAMIQPHLLRTGLSKVALSAMGRAMSKDLALFRAPGFARFAVPLLLPPWLKDGTMPVMVPEGMAKIGQKVLAYRSPNLHGGSIVPATVIGFTDSEVVALPFQMKSNMDGDYDGDIVNIITTKIEHHLWKKMVADAHAAWELGLQRPTAKKVAKKATFKAITSLIHRIVKFWDQDGIGRREGALRRAAYIIQGRGGDPAKELGIEFADIVTATIDMAKHTDNSLGSLKAFKERLAKIAGRHVDADIQNRFSIYPKAPLIWRKEIAGDLMFKMRMAMKDRTLKPLMYKHSLVKGKLGTRVNGWEKISLQDSWRPWTRSDLVVWKPEMADQRIREAKDIAAHMGDYHWLLNLGPLFEASREAVRGSFLDFKVGLLASDLHVNDRGTGGFKLVWNAAIKLLKENGADTRIPDDVEKFFEDFATITGNPNLSSSEKEEAKIKLLSTKRTVEFWLKVVIRNLMYKDCCGDLINNPRIFRDGIPMRIWTLIDKKIGDNSFNPGPEELRVLAPSNGYVPPPVDWMLDAEC